MFAKIFKSEKNVLDQGDLYMKTSVIDVNYLSNELTKFIAELTVKADSSKP